MKTYKSRKTSERFMIAKCSLLTGWRKPTEWLIEGNWKEFQRSNSIITFTKTRNSRFTLESRLVDFWEQSEVDVIQKKSFLNQIKLLEVEKLWKYSFR